MYLWLKLVHVLAVVMFIGNIVTGVFWHKHAQKTRDPKLLAHTMAGVIRSDRLFTMPGVLLILASGVLAALLGGYPLLRTPWILWTLVLFGISGAVFGMRLILPVLWHIGDVPETGARDDSPRRAVSSGKGAIDRPSPPGDTEWYA